MTITLPAPRTIRRTAIAATLPAAIGALLLTGVLHIDAYPQIRTYGLSAGTATHYCYADFAGWHFTAGCETAR